MKTGGRRSLRRSRLAALCLAMVSGLIPAIPAAATPARGEAPAVGASTTTPALGPWWIPTPPGGMPLDHKCSDFTRMKNSTLDVRFCKYSVLRLGAAYVEYVNNGESPVYVEHVLIVDWTSTFGPSNVCRPGWVPAHESSSCRALGLASTSDTWHVGVIWLETPRPPQGVSVWMRNYV